MKVALVDPSLFTWPYDNALMGGLRAAGIEACVFGKALMPGEAPGPQPGLVEHFYPALSRWPLAASPPGLRRAIKGLVHGASMASLRGVLADWRPDVIHFQWAPLPVVDRRFLPAFRRLAPLVMTVHDSVPFNGNPGASVQRLGALEILRQFDALIVHTEQSRRRLIAHGLDGGKVTQVAHGLLDDSASALQALPPAESLASARITFVAFGKIKPYKGVDTLIEAVARIAPAQRARCRVLVVGEPHMDIRPLRALAERLGVTEVEFDLRRVPDDELGALFGAADAAVMPYREIDASGVLTIAIQAGRPIVASSIGNFAELLEPETNALLVPSGDAAALAAAMDRFVADAALRGRLAAGVRDLRGRIPGWAEIGRATVAVYQRLRDTAGRTDPAREAARADA